MPGARSGSGAAIGAARAVGAVGLAAAASLAAGGFQNLGPSVGIVLAVVSLAVGIAAGAIVETIITVRERTSRRHQ